MAGLFGAIWLALQGAASVKNSIEKQEALSKPSYTSPETGQPVYHDNHMRAYGRNGEKLEPKYTHMPNGELRIQMVGKRSGIVYEDDYARKMQRINTQDEEELKREKEYGYLAYRKYHELYKNWFTTEISTGKIIAALYAKESEGIYRKFYLKSKPISNYTQSEKGDFGVPITRWEYEKFEISSKTFSELPDVYESIGKEADPYYEIEDKFLFDKMKGNDRIGENCEIYIYDGSYIYRNHVNYRILADKGIVRDTKDYQFVVQTEKHGRCMIKPCYIKFLGKNVNYNRCVVTDNGIEKQGIVKKIENGQYFVEFSDGSTRYVDGRFGNIRLM